jgi:hypothetical protein
MLGHSLAVRANHQMMRNCQPEQLLKLVPVMGVTIVLAGSLVALMLSAAVRRSVATTKSPET